MNRMQEWLQRAAGQLGLRVEVDHEVKLPDGRTVIAAAYFPDLSNRAGILVFEWSNEVDAQTRRALETIGMGVSTFGAPGDREEFDIGGYKEMFCEWGWTGRDDAKPHWMP